MTKLSTFLAFAVIVLCALNCAQALWHTKNNSALTATNQHGFATSDDKIEQFSLATRFLHVMQNLGRLPQYLYYAIKHPKAAYDDFLHKYGNRFSQLKNRIKQGSKKRYQEFVENLHKIAEHKLKFANGEKTYDVEVNHLADLLDEDFKRLGGTRDDYESSLDYKNSRAKRKKHAVKSPYYIKQFKNRLAENHNPKNAEKGIIFNWADYGVVSPVPDQNTCGSCWAFASHLTLHYSKQQLLDCSSNKEYGNLGCDGGGTWKTFNYAKDQGISLESSYTSYANKVKICSYNKTSAIVFASEYGSVTQDNEDALLEYLHKKGPIVVMVEHNHDGFRFYKSGVYIEPACTTETSHVMLLTGYGKDPKTGQDFWLIRNSWATTWGEDGYMRLARNRGSHCGVAKWPYWVSVA